MVELTLPKNSQIKAGQTLTVPVVLVGAEDS